MDDLKQIGRSYLIHFSHKNWAEVRNLISDDFHYKGHLGEFFNAEDAIKAFTTMSTYLQGIEIISEIVESNEAVFIYAFHCVDPIGSVPFAEHMTFENGKVISSRIYNDPRKFEEVTDLGVDNEGV